MISRSQLYRSSPFEDPSVPLFQGFVCGLRRILLLVLCEAIFFFFRKLKVPSAGVAWPSLCHLTGFRTAMGLSWRPRLFFRKTHISLCTIPGAEFFHKFAPFFWMMAVTARLGGFRSKLKKRGFSFIKRAFGIGSPSLRLRAEFLSPFCIMAPF